MSAARRASACSAEYEEREVGSLHINTSAIPDYARDELAAATLDFIRSIMQQPGGREALNARKSSKTLSGQ